MHPSEILRKGEEIDVVVLDIDKEKHRISLGFKQLTKDPWPDMMVRYGVGAETKGKIVRMTDRGVTVVLEGDVEGFVPVTQLGKEVTKPSDAFTEGDILPLKVLEFDPRDHRIVLSVTAYFDGRRDEDLEQYVAAHPIKTQKLSDVAHTKNVSGEHDDEVEDAIEEAIEEKSDEKVEEPVEADSHEDTEDIETTEDIEESDEESAEKTEE
jgi:small subunit ribosomal protein S1